MIKAWWRVSNIIAAVTYNLKFHDRYKIQMGPGLRLACYAKCRSDVYSSRKLEGQKLEERISDIMAHDIE